MSQQQGGVTAGKPIPFRAGSYPIGRGGEALLAGSDGNSQIRGAPLWEEQGEILFSSRPWHWATVEDPGSVQRAL
jgi:hypothetical protein